MEVPERINEKSRTHPRQDAAVMTAGIAKVFSIGAAKAVTKVVIRSNAVRGLASDYHLQASARIKNPQNVLGHAPNHLSPHEALMSRSQSNRAGRVTGLTTAVVRANPNSNRKETQGRLLQKEIQVLLRSTLETTESMTTGNKIALVIKKIAALIKHGARSSRETHLSPLSIVLRVGTEIAVSRNSSGRKTTDIRSRSSKFNRPLVVMAQTHLERRDLWRLV